MVERYALRNDSGGPGRFPRELVEDDLRQGFVSPEAAARHYGYRAAE